ncbi:uncharacterized protein LOC131251264 isoform X2 [Magnolia sinica]|uniref:uncharacterized protein LOC131251264 isoform X2 n=1 Tax=Magnolia sinica TaxID=86752 RepID=UPI002659BF63|nr:uncharacterized protein LOC131251264 isoform X2 [Magnolia sinica]
MQASRRGKESATQQQQEMTDCDGPLDFEFEDQLLTPTISVPKKRKKVIGLDDLLTDFYKEKNKRVERETTQKCYNSDEDDDNSQGNKEVLLSKFVDDCQKQVHEISTEEEFFAWGQQIFGQQKSPPPFAFPGVRSITLLQSFTNNELNSMTELVAERGETFLEGLLLNGWLSKLVIKCGHVEDSIVSWTLYLMFYSSNEDLQDSACHFWLSILASKNEVNVPSIRLGHFPSYTDLKDALETYGYLSESSINISSLSKMGHTDSGSEGPPQNLRSWLKYLAACCQLRIPKDFNSLKVVKCIFGVDTRTKHLRSELAFQILANCFYEKASYFLP